MAVPAKKPITITRATPYDAVRIARLLEEWFQVTSIAWPQPRAGDMTAWALSVIERGYVVIAEKDGRLFGTAAIQRYAMPWNIEQPLYRDEWFYVPPAHRKLGVADALMDALKLRAAKDQLPMMCAIISGTNAEKVDKWYGIKGGKYAGGVLVFGLPDRES